jgi:hypothetical protein
MCKWQRVIPRHKGSPRYRIGHGWKIEYGPFDLEALNFLMHFREPGSSLYFYLYTSLYFSSFSLLSFFLSSSFFSVIHSVTWLSHRSFDFLFAPLWTFLFAPLWTFFIFSPLNSKIAPYLPPPPCLDVAHPRAKRRWRYGRYRKYFSFGEILEVFNLGTIDLPWIDDPYSTIGCGQGGNHKRWYLVLRMDIRRGLWNFRCGDKQCTDKRLAIR